MLALTRLTEDSIRAIEAADYEKLGNLIDRAWRIKVGLSPLVSNSAINKMVAIGRIYGAYGAKVCGAGAGDGCGVLLLICPPEKQQNVINALPDTIPIPFAFDFSGSQVIFASR